MTTQGAPVQDPRAALRTALEEAHAVCGPLLELCRQRLRVLLGSPHEGPATDPPTELERLALELTEQYVIDVAGTRAELVAALQTHLGPAGLYALVMGLYVVDQTERLALTRELVG